MTDNEIIQQYKKYEPFFTSWYIKRFIGEGGFAKVFEITRNDFGEEYASALKIITVSKTKSEIMTLRSEGMTDDDIRGYLRGIVEDTVSEIKLMYKLRGRGNIVSYEDHAVMEHEDGMGWDILIKMEYLTSLSNYIYRQKGRLAKRDIIKLGVDICKSLEACQKYNIIHRDIKADNIFISDDGEFKLGDFGIARVIERKDQTLSKKGTSAYMAPEVYKGQTYTSAVDIYSLGMVMYRLMNNNRGPFLPPYPEQMSLDDRDHAMMLRMSGEKFPKPNQVTRGRLVEIVLKACSYRPEERYSSPGFMRQELESIYLDADEMTTEEWVMIYDAEGSGTAVTLSTSQSSLFASNSPEPTGATEVLRDEGATEVLRSDATEVLREEGATEVLKGDATEVLREEQVSAPVQSMISRTRKPCIKCGNSIEHNAVFCSFCGASQQEELQPQTEPRMQPQEEVRQPVKPMQQVAWKKSPQGQTQESGTKQPAWKGKKFWICAGISVGILILSEVFGKIHVSTYYVEIWWRSEIYLWASLMLPPLIYLTVSNLYSEETKSHNNRRKLFNIGISVVFYPIYVLLQWTVRPISSFLLPEWILLIFLLLFNIYLGKLSTWNSKKAWISTGISLWSLAIIGLHYQGIRYGYDTIDDLKRFALLILFSLSILNIYFKNTSWRIIKTLISVASALLILLGPVDLPHFVPMILVILSIFNIYLGNTFSWNSMKAMICVGICIGFGCLWQMSGLFLTYWTVLRLGRRGYRWVMLIHLIILLAFSIYFKSKSSWKIVKTLISIGTSAGVYTLYCFLEGWPYKRICHWILLAVLIMIATSLFNIYFKSKDEHPDNKPVNTANTGAAGASTMNPVTFSTNTSK